MSENIRLELQELGAEILSASPRIMPFALKNNYFEQFGKGIIHTIHTETQAPDFLQTGNRDLPFSTPPVSYFEELSANILAKISTEEHTESYTDWGREMPYHVPLHYFDQLPGSITKQVAGKPESKIRRIPLFKTFQLAASIALIVFLGLGIILNNPRTNKASTEQMLSSLSQTEIENYINNNIDDFDTDLIIDGLANNGHNVSTPNISKEEIRAYLDEYGWN